jgi:hypothetical protein
MSDMAGGMSPQVIVGIVFLVLALVVGYLVLFADSKKADSEKINADDYFKAAAAPDTDLDEKFKEYLAQEKDEQKMEESVDILSGQTERYEWHQTSKEIDVYIPLDVTSKSRDIKCNITAAAVTVTVQDVVVLEGSWVSEVVPSECNWQIGWYRI